MAFWNKLTLVGNLKLALVELFMVVAP